MDVQESISQYPACFLWLLFYSSVIALGLALLANTYKLKPSFNIFLGLNIRLRAGVVSFVIWVFFSLHHLVFFLLISNSVAPRLWYIDLFHIKGITAIFPE